MSVVHAQNFIFAQLTGTPVNTSGWNFQGGARVTNVTGTGNSEILLCPVNSPSGAVFFNQPINLSLCSKWKAEFDFRMYDGTAADGFTFCFLDVPPTGFISGGGLGIPATANGLKVCFDTYNNCTTPSTLNVPKIEIRWGLGYGGSGNESGECINQPTRDNSDGKLSFIRSKSYNHARVEYDNGKVSVYVNDVLYLTGSQQFNFNGYLGFTASTGGQNDNHSIKNVIIYTEMPPSEAGNDVEICPGDTVQLGTSSDPNYLYSWSPAVNLNDAGISNPLAFPVNNTDNLLLQKYYVNTSFAGKTGCASVDSVIIKIHPRPKAAFAVPVICLPNATAAFINTTSIGDGTLDQTGYLWSFSNGGASTAKNGVKTYSTPGNYTTKLKATSAFGCMDSVTNSFVVNPQAKLSLTALNEFCQDTAMQFNAAVINGIAIAEWSWNFGDNAIDSVQSPTHVYIIADTFAVHLNAITVEGCNADTVMKNVIINPLPVAAFGFTGLTCKNQNIVFTDSSKASIGTISSRAWTFDDGSISTGSPATHIYKTDGTFPVSLSVKNSKGCNSKLLIKNVIINTSPIVAFGMPQICNGINGFFNDSSTITDGTAGAFTYKWNIENTNYFTAAAQHVFANAGNYPVKLVVKSSKGCSDSLTRTVAVSSYPVTDFAILTTDFCGNLPLLIKDNSSVNYAAIDRLKVFWNWPATDDTSEFDNPVAGNIYNHTYEGFGYQPQKQVDVKVQAYSTGGCYTEKTASSILFASPRLVFTPIQVYCNNIDQSILLQNARDTSSFSGTGFYYGDGIVNKQYYNPSLAGTGNHLITYSYTLVNGCFDSASVTARVAPQPVVNAGADVTILEGGITTLNGTATGGNTLSYTWTPSNGLSSATILAPTATPVSDTYYTLKAVNEDGCNNSDEVFVHVLKTPVIPNAFSPNGDGINDTWQITYLNSYPGCVVQIFNRYGQIIFQSVGYSKPWDGTYNGQPLPIGTYYYVIDTKRIARKLSGYVAILR